MKDLFIIALLTITTLKSFGQNTPTESYGPVPYRTPEQTIGEYYVATPPPLNKFKEDPLLDFVGKRGSVMYEDVLTKKFTLTKIADGIGYFKDQNGVEYKSYLADNIQFNGLIPLKDLDESRNLFVGKTLWIKNYQAQVYHVVKDEYTDTIVSTFKPVSVTNITVGRYGPMPLVFTFKMANGKTACYGIDVSGTNTYRQPQYFLEENFYLKDPHLIYHFSPVVWRQIESGETPIGMSTDAFELVKGKPNKINRSRTGNTFREQWVYGEDSPRYYYFTNDKYTGYN